MRVGSLRRTCDASVDVGTGGSTDILYLFPILPLLRRPRGDPQPESQKSIGCGRKRDTRKCSDERMYFGVRIGIAPGKDTFPCPHERQAATLSCAEAVHKARHVRLWVSVGCVSRRRQTSERMLPSASYSYVSSVSRRRLAMGHGRKKRKVQERKSRGRFVWTC